MKMEFHYGNRMKMYETLPEGTIVMVFSGHAQSGVFLTAMMRASKPGMYEYQYKAEIPFCF